MTVASKNRHFVVCVGTGLLIWGSAGVHADIDVHSGTLEPLGAIRAAAAEFVRAQMPGGVRGITVTAGELDSRLRFVRCSGPLKASLVSGGQLQARTAVGVACRSGSGAHWNVYVPVTIESEIPVLVLRAPAVRGTRLTRGDVETETRRVSGFAIGYVTDLGALERSTVKRPLPAGAVLTADALDADFIVKQGEQVTLAASASGIEVRAAGKALENGREGARIRVQNLASLKVVEGVVDSSRVIHVSP